MRLGLLTPEFQNKLNECLINQKPQPDNGIIPTKIYAINKQVDAENSARLQELPGEVVTVQAVDVWRIKPQRQHEAKLLMTGIDSVIPSTIDLKVGAQVMLLRNRATLAYSSSAKTSPLSLVNGSRGKVVDIIPSALNPSLKVPVVLFDNGLRTVIGPTDFNYHIPGVEGAIVRTQLPLKLAW